MSHIHMEENAVGQVIKCSCGYEGCKRVAYVAVDNDKVITFGGVRDIYYNLEMTPADARALALALEQAADKATEAVLPPPA